MRERSCLAGDPLIQATVVMTPLVSKETSGKALCWELQHLCPTQSCLGDLLVI